MSDVYKDWGFSGTPFGTDALQANQLGAALLVGRDQEVLQLSRRLQNPPKMATVEGPNGIGKTSLVNVTTYNLFQGYKAGTTPQLLIPCSQTFQLEPKANLPSFEARVFRAVADTLLEVRKSIILPSVPTSQTAAGRLLDASVESRLLRSLEQLSESAASQATHREQLISDIKQVLAEIFPEPRQGGVVCIIDNLELLQTSEAARDLLEQLRDRLLITPGIRWVLCGATNIVPAVASSPRLEGYMHAPIEVGQLDSSHAPRILPSRVSAFAAGSTAYLPLIESNFLRLYEILQGNLRATLNYADNYCMWVADRTPPQTEEDKAKMFESWLNRETQRLIDSTYKSVTQRAQEVFQKAIDLGGSFSPGDYEDFQASSSQALRPHVKALEDVSLLASSYDDVDRRRKTITITPKGWFVSYGLSQQAQRPSSKP